MNPFVPEIVLATARSSAPLPVLGGVKVPLSYMDEFYDLRLHVGYIRDRLEERLAATFVPRSVEGDLKHG